MRGLGVGIRVAPSRRMRGGGSGGGYSGSLLTGLNESFPMSGTGTDDETSTVNGYFMDSLGNPCNTTTAFGGLARSFPGGARFDYGVADNNFKGKGTDYSKAVAIVPTSLGGNQIVYCCLDGSGVPTWMIRVQGTDGYLWFGNGSSTAAGTLVASGLSNGTGIVISFSVNAATKIAYPYVNGVLGTPIDISAQYPIATSSINASIGGWAGGQEFIGKIAAPTGWTRVLSDAEHLAWYNSGNVLRL